MYMIDDASVKRLLDIANCYEFMSKYDADNKSMSDAQKVLFNASVIIKELCLACLIIRIDKIILTVLSVRREKAATRDLFHIP